MKKTIKIIGSLTLYLLMMGFAFSFCVNASSASPVESNVQFNDSTNHPTFDNALDSTTNKSNIDLERNNFDIASLLSLLGIGFLKFVDDKLKIKWKDNYLRYKNTLYITTLIFTFLFIAILLCYIFKWGPLSFGNLKNVFLSLIPVTFCLLTLFTAKNECSIVIVSQNELDKKINDFTSSGMSPLGMIVGDMDFFGNVYDEDMTNQKKGRKVRHHDNIINNSQIDALVKNRIDTIDIVCKMPTTKEAYRRIGYLLDRFEGQLHIKFFNEDKFPIPKMRGRIMYKQNVQVVVITKKIRKPSQYEYSEYPVSSLPGGLFADLWNVVWDCSEEREDILNKCKLEYYTYTKKPKSKEETAV